MYVVMTTTLQYNLPRLPCGILIAALYCPSETYVDKQRERVYYLNETLDRLCNKSPDCGIIVDENNLDESDLQNQQSLTTVVKDPTRLNATRDLIFTNMKS